MTKEADLIVKSFEGKTSPGDLQIDDKSKALLIKLLANPAFFPDQFKSWLEGIIPMFDLKVPISQVAGKITSAMITDGTIVDGDVAAANKDGTAATPSLRTLGTGATQACAGNDSRVTGAAAAVQPAWAVPTLLNSWANYGGTAAVAGYFKDTLGMVHIKGAIKNGSSAAAVMFTLPAGYRPSEDRIFPGASNEALSNCVINITSAGNVNAGAGGSVTWTSFGEIIFRAA